MLNRRQLNILALGIAGTGAAPLWAEPEVSGPADCTTDLTGVGTGTLFALQVQIMEELKVRGVLRSANNITGDYAEALFCKAFGWQQAAPSAKGYDAEDASGRRYQIKARRLVKPTTSRQLSALRDLSDAAFSVLAGVLFSKDYSVLRAALIPYEIVMQHARYTEHSNSHRFHLNDNVWDMPGVADVTQQLQEVRL